MITPTNATPGSRPAIKPRPGLRHHLSARAAANQDATMATMLMNRLPDGRQQHQCHRLEVLDKDRNASHTYPLNRRITSVGRSRQNDVCIDDRLVSAKHLAISIANHTCVVNDIDSSNGTSINGQRISGFQTIKDGDEIMIGNTVLQYAAPRQDDSRRVDAVRQRSFVKPKWFIVTAAIFSLALAAAAVFQVSPHGLQRLTAKAAASFQQTPQASRPASTQQAANLQVPVAPAAVAVSQPSAVEGQKDRMQQALADYVAGRLDNARKTLLTLAASEPQTAATAQALKMLSKLDLIRQIHDQALEAQGQKQFTQALECWDRLLALDSELIGDRPSYFALQAEQRVQHLSYDYALDALRQNNHQVARQLCQVILQIDPRNTQALALMAKIESMS